MAKFLNTKLLVEWIPKVIEEADKEIVILVPYIQTSERLYNSLQNANNRGVEILLVYREEKLNRFEKDKLLNLENLNLMHHPNLHAKRYMSENYTIISSMNMYEYSEKNNREMGVLFHKVEIEENKNYGLGSFTDDENLFQNIVEEISLIVRSSEMERKSILTTKRGFEINLIKLPEEQCMKICNQLNELFLHKNFRPNPDLNLEFPVCNNYYDHIDVGFNDNGVLFQLKFNEVRNRLILKSFIATKPEDDIIDFKLFYSEYSHIIYLCRSFKSEFWDSELDFKNRIKKYQVGIESLYNLLKPYLRS